jgi:hypothetical protein
MKTRGTMRDQMQQVSREAGRRRAAGKLPGMFSKSEGGQRLAGAAGTISAGVEVVLTDGLPWPVRIALAVTILAVVQLLVWLAARRFGEEKSGRNLWRDIGTFVGVMVSLLVIGSAAWAVSGQPPAIWFMVGLAVVSAPVWWFGLRWWASTSPGSVRRE